MVHWASLGFPAPSSHLHTGTVEAPIPLLQTGNAACLPSPKLFSQALKECLVVLIIPTKVKCSNTSNHPWAGLDGKHSLYPGCSEPLAPMEEHPDKRPVCATQSEGCWSLTGCSPRRETTGQPRLPQQSPWAAVTPPIHSHIGLSSIWCRPNQGWQSQNHLGQRRPLRSSTASINLTQWILLLPRS